MKTMIVQHRLVQAPGIDVFRSHSGKRIMRMPYWLKSASGPLVFDFIDNTTNVAKLQELIAAGVVWVREDDVDE